MREEAIDEYGCACPRRRRRSLHRREPRAAAGRRHGARGQTPEQIRDDFPSLTLAQIHGAIVYYLEHQAQLDDYFEQNRRVLDELHAATYATQAEFVDAMRARIEAARAIHQ